MRALILVFGSILHFSYGLTNGIEGFMVYLKDSNSMYKYHKEDATWDDAKATCANEGAVLFFPENNNEATAVVELFSISTFWVGAFRISTSSNFTTMDGRQMNKVNHGWDIYPFSADRTGNCMLFTSRKLMNVYQCNEKYSFVCKYGMAQPCNCGTSTEAVQIASSQTVTPQTETPQTVTPQTVLCDHHFGEGNHTVDHTLQALYFFKEIIGEELNKFPPSETLAVKTAIMNAIVEEWQRVNGTIQETVDLTFKQKNVSLKNLLLKI